MPPKTSEGLSSEDESNDLKETRLVGYSRETESSNSSCSEPNEALDQAEIVPSTDVDLCTGSENRPVDEEFSDLNISTEESVSTRPQRQCRPPQIFTYNSLGNLEYQRVNPLVNRGHHHQLYLFPIMDLSTIGPGHRCLIYHFSIADYSGKTSCVIQDPRLRIMDKRDVV